jgi:AcrR family transcriptional regulator
VSKSEQTRALILDTALRLFAERGYEETTMRAVAESAGIALGGAYYYFSSKEQLVQAFYARLQQGSIERVAPVLERERTLERRLAGAMEAVLDGLAPYHPFAGVLFKTAADPASPLNPFSAESASVRGESVAMFARLVEGSTAKVPSALRDDLPFLLWLYHMGLIMYWVFDRSEGQSKSRWLAGQTVPIVCRLLRVAGLPGMGGLVRSAAELVRKLRS